MVTGAGDKKSKEPFQPLVKCTAQLNSIKNAHIDEILGAVEHQYAYLPYGADIN